MIDLPKTVDEAVDQLLAEMTPEEREIMANIEEHSLWLLEQLISDSIDSKLRQPAFNRELYKDCKIRSGKPELDEAEASKVIIQEIWKRLQQTHRLRVLK